MINGKSVATKASHQQTGTRVDWLALSQQISNWIFHRVKDFNENRARLNPERRFSARYG
jgi:hypothetical protein